MGSLFPWDILKAECLRLVCFQVTGGRLLQRREEMINFLKEVNEDGLDLALASLEELNSNTPTSPVRKRKVRGDPLEGVETSDDGAKDLFEPEAYNTRYKGTKRVKMTKQVPDETPAQPKRGRGRPRKSAPAALGTQSSKGQPLSVGLPNGNKTKRPRGRPPKHAASRAPKQPRSKVKQVFDGVVLSLRKKSTVTGIRRGASPHSDADAEGEMDVDAVEVWEPDLPEASSPQKSLDGVEESSLGDSNKENQSHLTPPNGHLPSSDDASERPQLNIPHVPVVDAPDELLLRDT
ncbi:hypothetical protein CPB83DRAFT_850061 [Crepidotus variabilis]|uniref:Uncharacterized protein n=1 Tax=Crepidotus variabilis TaxID=179855 RepID=A0A9P6JRD4_9AGAR|nr:hypothetical protein CPB83DRAFT_850061 [Crepidotus variabilis]